MPRADLVVYNIGELVTFRGGPLRGREARDPQRAGILRNAGVAVRSGRIIDYGASSEIRARYEAAYAYNARGLLVTPGLVDPHTHLVFAGSREDELELKLLGYSYEEILARGGGIHRTVRATREASVEELERLARERLLEMARNGTTVVEVKTGYGLLPEYEYKMLEALRGLRAPGLPRIIPTLLAHVIPQEYKEDREGYVELFIKEIVPGAKRVEPRPVYIDVFCDKGAFTVEETRRILQAGLNHGYRLRLHAEELAYIGCSDLAGEMPIDSVDHLEYLPPGNAELLASRGTVATLLPSSMLSVFSDKKPPVEALREAGAIVALATDYNPNNMNPSMQSVIDLAVYLLGMTPLEALAAATVNAARSLRLDGSHGLIARGASADLVVWEVPSYRWVGYKWGVDRVREVFVGGVPVKGGMD